MSVSVPAPLSLLERVRTVPRARISPRALPHEPSAAPATGVDVRPALDRAVDRVPALAGRVTILCGEVVASIDLEVVEEVITHLLRIEAAIPDHRVVWISAVPGARGVVLTVEDDADWVADDPALRRGRTTTSATLQLARVAQLARSHGGACWVEPAAGQGMCFVVDLPGRLP